MAGPLDFWRGTRNPFRELTELQKAFDRAADDWGFLTKNKDTSSQIVFSPNCEVTEDKTNYHFKFDIPGLTKDQVKVEIHDRELTVSGERKQERKEDGKKYHFTEVSYGSFLRTFTLPTNADPEKCEAKFENGVLSVNIAKSENTRSREVSVR